MKLFVFRGARKVGVLDIEANESFFGFTYDNDYLASSEALPLSVSLPLAETRYPGNRAQAYFEGLLPEGEARDAIARRLGIPRKSSVKLLAALGRDCAGDVTIINENEIPKTDPGLGRDKSMQYLRFDEGGISRIAGNPHEEISRLQEDTRLSLAGAQGKLALYHKHGESIQGGWYVPAQGSPSTHIVKPGILESHYPHITLNEFLCVRAAPACGIPAAGVDILFPETPVIIASRYDRVMGGKTVNGLEIVDRMHQEDCCQACGVKSEQKYEHDGGPGFKQIRDMLTRHSRIPAEDITLLVKWGLYNFLIGNCDAHSKNLSILQNSDGTVSLAPVYDLICTTIYDGHFGSKLSRNLGMRIGIHENIDKVSKDDFSVFAKDVSIRLQQVRNLSDEIVQSLPSALFRAASEAEDAGFTNAGEVAGRIISNSENRIGILKYI